MKRNSLISEHIEKIKDLIANNAYLNGNLEEHAFTKQPAGLFFRSMHKNFKTLYDELKHTFRAGFHKPNWCL